MRLLVTGSSGQIGSYTVEAAKALGWDVRGLDLRASRWTTQVGDIRKKEDCDAALQGVDAVVHLAAHVLVPESVQDPRNDADHNVLGTVTLLDAARRADTHRFLFVSSAAVYGPPEKVPIAEDHPTRPISPYGVAKLAGERYAGLLPDLYGIAAIIARPFNVYSPRQDPRSDYAGVMSRFAQRVRGGEPPLVYGDGGQTRDFVHASDVGEWLVRLSDPNVNPGPKPVNLGSGVATRIRDLAQWFLEAAAVRGVPERLEPRPGDILHSVADVTRMRALGLSERQHVRANVPKMIAAFR